MFAQNVSAIESELALTPSSFDYQGKFVTPALQQQGLELKNGFLDFCQTTADRFAEQGGKLWEFCYRCKRDLGEEKGKAAFYDWIDS